MRWNTQRTWRRAVTLVAVHAVALGLGAVAAPARADWAPADPSDPATPPTVTADALSTVQIDGVVWSQAMAGNTVFAGGDFDTARPAGANAGVSTTPRQNFVAYDVRTGEMTGFAPSFNQQIRAVAVSPDGSRLYVGGEFTMVDGVARSRVAAFDLASGALVASFNPQVNGTVQAIAVTDDTVYVGGSFGGVGNQTRGSLAAFSTSGALLTWAPTVAGGAVQAMAVSPDGSRVLVGGAFTTTNGDPGPDTREGAEPGDGLAMFSATTGATLPLAAGQHIYTANNTGEADGAITALAADANAFYGTGYTYASIEAGTVEGTFAVNWDGTLRWVADCHGDSYSVHPQGDAVYVASHTHYCENMGGVAQGAGGVGDYPYYRAVAYSAATTGKATYEPDSRRYYNFEGQPTPSQLTWYPSINAGTFTGQSQGPWSVTGNSQYVVMAGEFTRVNGQNQQGLVRFARADVVADKAEGPTLFNDSYPLKATSTEAGTVRLSWATNQDIDNDNLTYRLQRRTPGGTTSLVTSRTERAHFWNPRGMTYTQTGLTPGAQYEYRIQAVDPGGLTANSRWVPVTVASSGAANPYLDVVHRDEPTHWWRFGEPLGSTAPEADVIGVNNLNVGGGVARGAEGAIPNDPADRAATFTGTAAGIATSTVQDSPPDLFTVEAWFRTSSVTGGRIVGRDTAGTRSSKVDRVIYMDAEGHVVFGVKPDASRRAVTSPGTYNDGKWHHTAAVLSPSGMQLYVDGTRVGQDTSVTVGEHLAVGYWRVGGGGAVTGLPGGFIGDIDEVAVYKKALTAADVAERVTAAGKHAEQANQPPAAAFDVTVSGLTASFDSTTSDPDGTVASHLWTFGDGTTSTEADPVHTYTSGGNYTATLTVTDDDGGRTSVSKDVAAILPPTASFTYTVTDRTVDVTSTSTDPDGTIASYRWVWGDGTRDGRTATASHAYAADGEYPVKLTVTDDDGATSEVTQTVRVGSPPANQAPVASFTSSTSGLTATLTSTSTDADGTIASQVWDLGGGQTATGATATRTYAAAGTYDVKLTVTDDKGASAEVTKQVTVTAPPPANTPPTASFRHSTSGLQVTLTSTSTDADGIRSTVWRTGDGRTLSGRQVTYRYSRSGTYTVRLTVTDNRGASASLSRNITVQRFAVRAALQVKPAQVVRRGKPVALVVRLQPVVATAVRGTVKVYKGNRVVQKRTVTSAKPAPFTLRGLGVGKHRIRVVYTGSATTKAASSPVKVIRVRRS